MKRILFVAILGVLGCTTLGSRIPDSLERASTYDKCMATAKERLVNAGKANQQVSVNDTCYCVTMATGGYAPYMSDLSTLIDGSISMCKPLKE